MCVSNFIFVAFLWSVTWGMDTHNPNTFAALPRQESEAKQDGWTKIADCDSMYLATRKKVFKCISVFFFKPYSRLVCFEGSRSLHKKPKRSC